MHKSIVSSENLNFFVFQKRQLHMTFWGKRCQDETKTVILKEMSSGSIMHGGSMIR